MSDGWDDNQVGGHEFLEEAELVARLIDALTSYDEHLTRRQIDRLLDVAPGRDPSG